VHPVGFIIKIYRNAWSPEHQILNTSFYLCFTGYIVSVVYNITDKVDVILLALSSHSIFSPQSYVMEYNKGLS